MIESIELNRDNFGKQSLTWKKFFSKRNSQLPVYKKSETALLVIDMQNYFLEKDSPAYFPNSELIINNVNKLIEFAEFNNLPIIYTLQDNPSGKNNHAITMQKWWEQLPCSHYSCLSNKIKITDKSITLKKQTYSAFQFTGLDKYLDENKIDNLIICGLKTNLCCETTARDGFIKNYNIIFVADANITNNEFMQIATLVNLSYGFAKIVYTNEFKNIFTN